MTNSKDQYTHLQECRVLDEYQQHREPHMWRDEEGDYELKNEKR